MFKKLNAIPAGIPYGNSPAFKHSAGVAPAELFIAYLVFSSV